jgi:molecular chaperone HtpG
LLLQRKGYQVLLLDSPIISHLIQKLEGDNENLTFVRVDSDSVEKLIEKRRSSNFKIIG